MTQSKVGFHVRVFCVDSHAAILSVVVIFAVLHKCFQFSRAT